MSEFSKGEWKVNDGHYPGMLNIDCGGKMNLTVVTTATDITWQEGLERKANANLIACAPEMYAMLEVAAKQLSHSPIGYRINKLLEKARGEK
jgi:hypothetical protein